MKAAQIVEAVLFASDAPLLAGEIARADESLDEDRVEAAIQDLRGEYDETDRAFQIVELGEGYQILTRSEFASYLERFDTVPRPRRLSGPALETLAIVAYRQPVSRVEVEYVRGVSSSAVLKTLQDRELIEVVGREEGIGRPYLYGTTTEFLNHFGFRSLEELPRPEELPVVLRESTPLEEVQDEDDEEDAADGGPGAGVEAREAGAPEEHETVDEAVTRVLEKAHEEEGEPEEDDVPLGRGADGPGGGEAEEPLERPTEPAEGEDRGG